MSRSSSSSSSSYSSGSSFTDRSFSDRSFSGDSYSDFEHSFTDEDADFQILKPGEKDIEEFYNETDKAPVHTFENDSR